ncbi:DNA-processing protein DprA [Herbidospora sp. RD11066]
MAHWDARERAAIVASLRRVSSERNRCELVQRVTEEGSARSFLRECLGQADLFADPVDVALEEALLAISSWEDEGIQVLTMGDEAYPHRLRDVFDRPPVLFAHGTVRADDRGVAVVGSRHVSDDGRKAATELAARLVSRGLTVVSGLASGVDTAAHTGALEAGGRTVAVIGTGVRHVYPPENRGLHQTIAENGAVFSQFWPDERASKLTFPLRNGTMSGYAMATIIIEAGERSGTRIQARKAVEHGRPVILMAPVVHRTSWGREMTDRPDVHVANTVDEALGIVETILNRHNEIERFILEALAQ